MRKLAESWRESAERPRATEETLTHWDRLVEAWLETPSLPLLLRVSKGNRGELLHHKTGRSLVCADNAPANWALSCAIHGRTPALAEVSEGLAAARIPIAFALKRAERAVAHFTGTQRRRMDPPNLNTLGWEVCHILDVGLNTPAPVLELPLEELHNHHRLFLHPRNMFVVPKGHGGVGDSSVFQGVFREGH